MTKDVEHIIGIPKDSSIYGKLEDAAKCELCGGLPTGQLHNQRFRLMCNNCNHTVHYKPKHGLPLKIHIAYWNGRQECIRRARECIALKI